MYILLTVVHHHIVSTRRILTIFDQYMLCPVSCCALEFLAKATDHSIRIWNICPKLDTYITLHYIFLYGLSNK